MRFALRRFARGNDADNIAVPSLAMAHQKQSCVRAHAQQQKSFLCDRVLFVKELHRKVVVKHRLCHLEGDFMLLGV